VSASPTELSLRWLRADDRFRLVQVVEHWNPHARIRQDLFGIIDILAVGPGGTLAVQATSAGGFSARIKKLREHPSTPHVVTTPGWTVEVHGWKKVRGRWQMTHRKEFQINQPTTQGEEAT
jgi:hypothetical protein